LLAYGCYVYVKDTKAQAAQSAIQYAILAESAMNHIRSKSLQEVVQTGHMKELHSLEIDRLKNVLVKEQHMEKTKVKNAEPVLAVTEDGREIDLQEYDVIA
jgi:hypothetical protein